ncbi:MAG TPA: DNA methyltransferase [Nitrososphaerales archaeon]
MDLQKEFKTIDKLDWDFRSGSGNYGVHTYHWFPAKFTPQIPSILITLLSKRGDTVIDPFCGSGSTIVEALRLGRKTIGIDSNPLACLISRVKVTPISPKYIKERASLLRLRLNHIHQEVNFQRLTQKALMSELNSEVEATFDSPLNKWFSSYTLLQIRIILSAILEEKDSTVRNFFLVCLSDRLRFTSSQDRWSRHWGYIADNVYPKNLKDINAFEEFLNHLEQMIKGNSEFIDECRRNQISEEEIRSKCMVYEGNAENICQIIEDGQTDLIVTSPPYPGAVDYTNANRLSFYLLGYDLQKSKLNEIGARIYRGRRNFLFEYEDKMFTCLTRFYESLADEGHLALVLPDKIDVARLEVLERLIDRSQREVDFRLEKTISRKISHQITGARSITHEKIYIFSKRKSKF